MQTTRLRAARRLVSGVILVFAFAMGASASGAVYASGPALPRGPDCAAPPQLLQLGASLWRTRLALNAGEPLLIVAIGSSSTAGHGASSPSNTYPARLEAELRSRFPSAEITVLNRGVGGEDATEMLARLDEEVLREKPDLVLWQVGTNAVLNGRPLAGEAPLIREGIRRIRAAQADVILVDAQYAPEVIAKPAAQAMGTLLAGEARDEYVGLFRRFAVMRHWRETARIPFRVSISDDGLHMNDWSYACFARLFAEAITEGVRKVPVLAGARRSR